MGVVARLMMASEWLIYVQAVCMPHRSASPRFLRLVTLAQLMNSE